MIASALVLVLGIVSLVNDWGSLLIVPVLAALVVLGGILLPQLAPTVNLPAPKGLVMLLGGAAAALFWVIAAISWLDWIVGHLGAFDTLQFLVGLAASLVIGVGRVEGIPGGGRERRRSSTAVRYIRAVAASGTALGILSKA